MNDEQPNRFNKAVYVSTATTMYAVYELTNMLVVGGWLLVASVFMHLVFINFILLFI